MKVEVNGTRLWFDVSGPSITVQESELVTRPTLVTVHGGPGLDSTGLKLTFESFGDEAQILFYDQRGHGRSDHGAPQDWNLKTWAADLRALCDALGLLHPVVLGSSFGGFVALTYAALFPDHPAGIILANTTGGRTDLARSVEIFRRIGGEEAAAVAAEDFAQLTEASAERFNQVCFPLFSSKPGFVEESQQRLRLSVRTTDVNLHYFRNEKSKSDPWTLLPEVRCPVMLLAGQDDPMCPIELVRQLADGLANAADVNMIELPGARHTVFRDAPEIAFPAITGFLRRYATPDD